MTYPTGATTSDSVNLGSNPSSPATGNADVSGISRAPATAERSAQPEQTADTGRTETGTAHPLHFLDCACKAEDRYDCWAVRYDMPRAFYCQIDIDADGGPCECMCHDEEDDGVLGAVSEKWNSYSGPS
jgi:hypothetical protein